MTGPSRTLQMELPETVLLEIDAAAPAGTLGELARLARQHPGHARVSVRIVNTTAGRNLAYSYGDRIRVDAAAFRAALADSGLPVQAAP